MAATHDFGAAAQRCFDDGHALLREGRWANADHLIGIAVECALKRLLVALGHTTNAGALKQEHWVHLPGIWDQFALLAQGRLPSRVANVLVGSNAFTDWDVQQRYAGEGVVTDAAAKAHAAVSRTVMLALQHASFDGVL